MDTLEPIAIVSDNPETGTGYFGFEAYAKTITGIIGNPQNKTPMVIGIYGAWGSGKTSLMQAVKGMLSSKEFEDSLCYRKCKTVWFQAWKYGKEEEMLAALIEEIFKTMEQDNFLSAFKAEIEKLVNTINIPKLRDALLKFITGGGDITQIFSELEYKKKLGFYDTFNRFFDRLIWDYLKNRPQFTESEKPDDTKGALVIFIDDLDRCPKDRIVNVLETIKLFMDKTCCIFIIGAAHDIILKALKKTYEDDAVRFMDKIVQVSFNLPQIPVEDFAKYIDERIPGLKAAIVPHLPVIVPAIQYNPRQLKRFLNNLTLMEGIRRNRGIEIEFKHLLYWNIIGSVNPQLRDDICENPRIPETFRTHLKSLPPESFSSGVFEIPENFPQSLHVYLQNKRLMNILLNFDAAVNQVVQLITLSGMVKSAEEIGKGDFKDRDVRIEGMVKVSMGEFLYGADNVVKKIEVPYLIDIYPVTNEHYKAFIEAGGYDKEKLWSDEGWAWKQKQNITLPAYWNDEKWNKPGYPVVGVSYYEAEAYAKWAGKQLPTEIQWERAARGTDGNYFPWGNEFDKEKCNTKESAIGQTSRVTRYPNGVSPAGCYDMAGNVCEWTVSKSGEFYILCGSSWSTWTDDTRSSSRQNSPPHSRKTSIGFRCIKSV